jgi:hypothetical protein
MSIRRWFATLLILSVLGWTAGCSGSPSEPPPDDGQPPPPSENPTSAELTAEAIDSLENALFTAINELDVADDVRTSPPALPGCARRGR